VARSDRTALERFLLEHRSGHCEYFATATTLLLRQAGIPARYAVGYAVQEKKGRYYVVRERHAHAWCLAWIQNRWREVDTTPGSWLAIESQNASMWESIRDLFSRMSFEFAKWRWGSGQWKRYLVWIVWPLLVLAAVRLFLGRRWTRKKPPPSPAAGQAPWPGLDSAFYRIEQYYANLGLARYPSETMAMWLKRIGSQEKQESSSRPLSLILAWHYRLRFDPHGLEKVDQLKLNQAVEDWLREHPSNQSIAPKTNPGILRNGKAALNERHQG
jgi:hypothetical protein